MRVALCVLPPTQKRGYNLHRSLDSCQKTLTVKSCNMEKLLHFLEKSLQSGPHSSPLTEDVERHTREGEWGVCVAAMVVVIRGGK